MHESIRWGSHAGWSDAMHEWSKRMLLRHYLQEGVTKTELARRLGVSRRTIHYWIESGQVGPGHGPRPESLHAATGGGKQAGSLQGHY